MIETKIFINMKFLPFSTLALLLFIGVKMNGQICGYNDITLDLALNESNIIPPGDCECRYVTAEVTNTGLNSQEVKVTFAYPRPQFVVCEPCEGCSVSTTTNSTLVSSTFILDGSENKILKVGIQMGELPNGSNFWGYSSFVVGIEADEGPCSGQLVVDSRTHQLTGGTESSPEPIENHTGLNTTDPLRPECEACLQCSSGPQDVKFDGFLSLSSNYCFKGTSAGRSAIYMGNGAGIILNSGATLTLEKMDIIPCAEMWKYIKVKSGATLIIDDVNIVGGEHAIIVEDGGTLTMKNAKLEDNYIGLYLPGNTNGSGATVSLYGTTFITNSTLRPPYADKTHGFAGIVANAQPALNLSGVLTPETAFPNEYINLANGIILTNSTAYVGRSYFANILYVPEEYPVSGRGISHTSSVPGAHYLEVKGKGEQDASFLNCSTGVYLNGSNASLSENRMEYVETGVYLVNNRKTTIYDNYLFDCLQYGVWTAGNPFARISIYDNEFYVNQVSPTPDAIAIRMEEPPLGSPGYLNVRNNFIYLENAAEGILLNGSAFATFMNNSIQATENLPNAGIVVKGAIEPILSCNSVQGSGLNSNVGIYASMNDAPQVYCNETDNLFYGLQFVGMNNGANVLSNKFNGHYIGLILGQDNPGTQNDLTGSIGLQEHRGNQWLEAASSGGDQAFLVLAGTDIASINRFRVDSNEEPTFLATNNASAFGWFFDENISTTTPTCVTENLCPNGGIGYIPGIKTPDDLEIALAEDDTIQVAFQDGLVWSGRGSLYRRYQNGRLNQTISSVNAYIQAAETDLEGDFYGVWADAPGAYALNSNADSTFLTRLAGIADTINLLMEVDSIIAGGSSGHGTVRTAYINALKGSFTWLENEAADRYDAVINSADSLLTRVESINPGRHQLATYEQGFWKVYYTVLAHKSDTLSTVELTTLVDIAELCPLAGGRAVFYARALLNRFYPELVYNDSILCAQSGARPQPLTTEATLPQGRTYPNPGSDLIHILPGLSNDPVVDVKITDALGRTTAVTWSWEDERLLRVNVSQLPQGAYYALLLHQSGQWSTARWVKE